MFTRALGAVLVALGICTMPLGAQHVDSTSRDTSRVTTLETIEVTS
jgi:hypothetical protein